jgi:hypothetical protein
MPFEMELQFLTENFIFSLTNEGGSGPVCHPLQVLNVEHASRASWVFQRPAGHSLPLILNGRVTTSPSNSSRHPAKLPAGTHPFVTDWWCLLAVRSPRQ